MGINNRKFRKKTPDEIIRDTILESEENAEKNININLGRSFENINKDIESLIKEVYKQTFNVVSDTNNKSVHIENKTKQKIKYEIDKLPIKEKINKIKKEYETISLYNKRNFLNFLDNVVHPVVYNQIKNLYSPYIKSSFNIIYYKYGLKQETIKLPIDKKRKEEMNNFIDSKFTLNAILKKEGVLEKFKGLTLEEIRESFDIDVEQSYIHEDVLYKKGFSIEENGVNGKPRKGPPFIDSIDGRVKISKRLSKKIFDSIIGIDPIPLDTYKNLFYSFADKKYHKYPQKMNEKRFNKCVQKIHKYLCDVKINNKVSLIDERIPGCIDDMVGINRKEDYVNQKKGHVIEGHKVYGFSKSNLGSDLHGVRVVFKDADSIDKFLRELGSYFEQDHTKYFTHNKEREENKEGNGFVDIKDYRKNKKANNYGGVHAKIRYINTRMELQLRTKKDDEIAENGDADHKKYKFFQRLRRDIRVYNNPIDQGLFYAIDYLFEGLR